MKSRCNYFLSLFLLSFIFLSCDNAENYHWQKAINTDAYVWIKESQSFEWDGDVKGEFAHGQGTIQFIKGGNKSGKEKKTLFFGADKKEYTQLGTSENLYIGDFKKIGSTKVPNGKGVFVKPNGSVYAGDFSDGKITNGYHFVAEELQYSGSYLDNKYSGFGVYYKNGEILYSGNWLEGKQNGEGIEYHDNAEFKGTYKNGKKEGQFQIERSGTIRVVCFSDNVPNLKDCKIYFNDGTMWIGALTRNYELSGLGQTITSDGLVNFENRINGELIGEQKLTFPDGSSYEGEVKNGKRNGYGIQVYPTGITYYGNWENDYQNGYGDLDIDDNWYYSGEWKNGLYDGNGYFSFPDFSYEGEWKEGKKDGFGTLTLANLRYEGFWKDDAINGEGYISYSDGSYYEGSWKDNKRNGYGEYVWADGSSYYGNWEEDFPNGEGEINLSNGDYYTGEIEYGYFSGAGTYIFANGERYEGTFVENKKDGIGYYYFANGNSYEGEFKNNQPNGKGRFYFDNGTFYDGEFENGKLKGNGSLFIPEENDYTVITSSCWPGNIMPISGSVLFANGDEFVGTLENGMPTNDGTWTTREERLKGRSKSQIARDFYGDHQQTIQKAFDITELVLTGINLAATVVETMHIPYVSTVAAAVDLCCDIASCAISGANIAIKTAVLNYDIKDLESNNGTPKQVSELKAQYAKDIAGDVANISITAGLIAVQQIQAGVKAARAMEIYPKLKNSTKAIKKTGELTNLYKKAGKISDKLVRETVSLAYGKVGKKLLKTYGDRAAKFLFKYGDNAMYALTDGGEPVLKIVGKGNEKAIKVVFYNGEDAIKLLSKNLDNLDEVTELITKKGKAGIQLLQKLEEAGVDLSDFTTLYAKYGDVLIRVTNKIGKKRSLTFINLVKTSSDDFLSILDKTPKTKLKGTIDYLELFKAQGVKNLRLASGNLPNYVLDTPILKDAKKIDFLYDAIAGNSINPETGEVIQYVLPPDHMILGTKKLKPNVVYMTNANTYDLAGNVINNRAYFGGRYYYKTDQFGRVVELKTDKVISKKSLGRLERIKNYEKQPLGKIYGIDEAGHDVADSLNGSPFFDNIFPQNWVINRGKNSPWYGMEEEIRNAVEAGADVKLNVKHIYEGSEIRTKRYIVEYIIDGDVQSFVVDNENKLMEF